VELVANRPELTDAYHKLTGMHLDGAGLVAKNQFLKLGSWRDEDIQRYAGAMIPEMDNAKRTMANYTSSYYGKVAGLDGKKLKKLSVPATKLVTENLRNGTTADMVWERPFKEMWGSLKKGNNFTDSLNLGAARANSIARTEMQLAKREAGLYVRNGNSNIVGYLRTLSGAENCGMCYLASTQRYNRGDLLPIHPGCDCGETPIFGDTDVGQIIDDERLNATHEAVAERFGQFDTGGREIDYRKITIHNHGELGPYLGVKGQKFTKVPKAKLGLSLEKPKKVDPKVVKSFKENIDPKLKRISATKIADDIKLEHNDVFVPSLRGKAKIQTLGPKTTAHLDDIKKVGKDIDLEIDIRVKKAISEISSPAQIVDAQKQIKLGEELLNKANLEFESGVQRQIAFEQAKEQARGARRVKELLDDGFTKEYTDEYLENFFNQERVLRIASANARSEFRYTPVGRKLADEIIDYQTDIANYKLTLPANVIPGTQKYGIVYAEKAKEVLEEVRDLGNGGPKFVGSAKANVVLEEARAVYPNDWLEKAQTAFPEIKTVSKTRGYWNFFGREIAISYDKSNGFKNGYSTAVHEMGHMFEASVPGLKELEFAFAHQRAALGPKRAKWASKEVGFQDKWRNLYSGKDYGYNVNSSYEIFTTGIESVFSGSNMFEPTRLQSILHNPGIGPNAGTDDEFRQFILGVLFAL
jgi:hypothetical protein